MLQRVPWRYTIAALIGAALVFSVAFAAGLLPVYAKYCYYDQPGHQECASYNIMLVALFHAGKLLNDASLVITAIATGCIAYFTLTLKDSTDKLWNAGADQLRHFDDTAKKELRAYVSVEPRGVNQFLGRDYVIGHIRIRNVGRIPAKKVSIDFIIEHDQSGGRTTFIPNEPEQSEIVLQPRAVMEFGSPKGWTLPEGAGEDNPLDIDGYFFVWGRVTYTDEFNTVGWTNFCHRYPCQMFGVEAHEHSILRKFARIYAKGGNTAN